MYSGSCLGQHTFRAFPSSWKGLLESTGSARDRLAVFINKLLLENGYDHFFFTLSMADFVLQQHR